MKTHIRRTLFNLGVLSFGALPITILAAWMQILVAGGAGRSVVNDPASYLGAFAFWWLVEIVLVLVGGFVHQIIIYGIPVTWSRQRTRTAILLTAPVVLAAPLLFGAAPEVLLRPQLLLPITLGLLVYGLLAKPLRDKAE